MFGFVEDQYAERCEDEQCEDLGPRVLDTHELPQHVSEGRGPACPKPAVCPFQVV